MNKVEIIDDPENPMSEEDKQKYIEIAERRAIALGKAMNKQWEESAARVYGKLPLESDDE